MKKILVISLLCLFSFALCVDARTKYDETGRNIIYDGTLRGRKKAAEAQKLQAQKLQAAAAAKLNYEEALKSLEPEPVKKPVSNYYQDRFLEEDN